MLKAYNKKQAEGTKAEEEEEFDRSKSEVNDDEDDEGSDEETFEELQRQTASAEEDSGDNDGMFGCGSQEQVVAFGVTDSDSSVHSTYPSQPPPGYVTQEAINEIMRTMMRTMQQYHTVFSSWSQQHFGVTPPQFLPQF